MINPKVVDISHYQTIDAIHGGLAATKTAGYIGIIHKADQGTQSTDKTYGAHREAARIAKLKWGAYHFNTGEDVKTQTDHFFSVSMPDIETLMALDFEDNRASNMTLAQAVEFLDRGDQKLGRPLWLYGGNRIKETIIHATQATRDFLAKHPLWGCQYGPIFKLFDANQKALPWLRVSLHQFTGDGVGPVPHSVPGIVGSGIDINSYAGSDDDLCREWIGESPSI